MNIIDAIVILIVLGCGLFGFKRGVFKELAVTLGFIILIIISLYLKGPLAEFLSLHLPFFGNINSFNILLYQGIAFLILVIILEVILQIVIKVTGLFEKILKMTIVLGAVSKILGFIVGMLEGIIIAFVVLFILNQPVFDTKPVNESKFATGILNHTPVLSNINGNLVEAIDDIYKITKDTKELDNKVVDYESLDAMLKHKVINKDYVNKLIDKKKIDIPNVEEILNKY